MPIARCVDVLRLVAAAPLPGRPSAARSRLRRDAIELARSENLADAAYSYRIVALGAPAAASLVLGPETLYAPQLLPQSGELTAVACAVCTLGPALGQRVGALFAERRASLAAALDELGNELLMALSRRAQDRLQADVTRRGLTMAGELRAGDPGLALSAQASVVRLAMGDAIGVTVSPGGLMRPLKSTSMVLGVGVDLPVVRWSRCDPCPSRHKCRVAMQAESAALT